MKQDQEKIEGAVLGETVYKDIVVEGNYPEPFMAALREALYEKKPSNVRAYIFQNGEMFWTKDITLKHGDLQDVIKQDNSDQETALCLLAMNKIHGSSKNLETPTLLLTYDADNRYIPEKPEEIKAYYELIAALITKLKEDKADAPCSTILEFIDPQGERHEYYEDTLENITFNLTPELRR